MRNYFGIFNVTTSEEVPRKFLSVLESLGPGCFGLLEAFMTQLHNTKDCPPVRGAISQGTFSRKKFEVGFVRYWVRDGVSPQLSCPLVGTCPSSPFHPLCCIPLILTPAII